MKTTKFISAIIGTAVLFAACAKEDCPINNSLEQGEGAVAIRLKDASNAFTRAVTEGPSEIGSAGENKITGVEFYVFNSDGTLDPKASYLSYSFTEGESYTFPVTAGNKTILVAANMDLGQLTGTIDNVRKTIHDVTVNPLSIPDDGIPMAGEVSNLYAADGDVASTTIGISRLYAKFNAPTTDGNTEVVLKPSQESELEVLWGERPLVGKVAFTLNGHVVVNGLKKSYAFANYGAGGEADRWDSNVWQIGNVLANYTESTYDNGQLGNVYSGDSFLNGKSVYLYENSPLRVEEEISGSNSNTVYAMIIEGTLYDTGDNQNEITRYWRINLNKTDDYQTVYKIMRNTIYNINIQNIKTLGYGTPKEAEEEKPIIPDVDEAAVNVKIKPVEWRVFNENTDI